MERLVEPRIQLHYAAQAVTAVGKAFARAEPDFGHASFQWMAADGAEPLGPGVLAGSEVESKIGRLRAFLRLDRPAVGLVGTGFAPIGQLDLDGRTLLDAFEWLRQRTSEAGLDGARLTIKLPPDLPPHPVSIGERFAFADLDACSELAAWYGNADHVIRAVTNSQPRTTSVRCWPHHFDLAALVRLTDPLGEDAPCVGVGFSPGDATIDQPYLYVSPWPYPSTKDLPEAPDGSTWRTAGWVGLYLPAQALLVDHDPAGQATRARSFFAEGLELSLSLLEPASSTGSRER